MALQPCLIAVVMSSVPPSTSRKRNRIAFNCQLSLAQSGEQLVDRPFLLPEKRKQRWRRRVDAGPRRVDGIRTWASLGPLLGPKLAFHWKGGNLSSRDCPTEKEPMKNRKGGECPRKGSGAVPNPLVWEESTSQLRRPLQPSALCTKSKINWHSEK